VGREAVKNFDSLARWPLLLGAVILFGVALWEASHETDPERPIGIVAACVGCVLLGSWVWSLAIEAERKWHDRHKIHEEE
jgi:hypothetical protein